MNQGLTLNNISQKLFTRYDLHQSFIGHKLHLECGKRYKVRYVESI